MGASPAGYAYVRDMVQKRSGIALEDSKAYLIEARLTPVATDAGFPSLDAFLSHLRSAAWGALHVRAVEALTTNETSFFRDVVPFDAFRDAVIPKLIRARQTARTIQIWSAASSTGQEAYSLAMVIRERFPELADWKIRILGTDLSEAVLARARAGRYSQLEINRGLPAPFLVKYFTRVDNEWVVKPVISSMVEFMPMNLVTTWPSLPQMDVVFLRNVLIYFEHDTKRDILGRLRRVLARDGCLFLGGAETTLNVDDAFHRVPVGRAVYYCLTANADR